MVTRAGEVRSQIEAPDATNVTPAIHDAGSRESHLTTRIVNTFQTNPTTRLFQVVSGGRDRIGLIDAGEIAMPSAIDVFREQRPPNSCTANCSRSRHSLGDCASRSTR